MRIAHYADKEVIRAEFEGYTDLSGFMAEMRTRLEFGQKCALLRTSTSTKRYVQIFKLDPIFFSIYIEEEVFSSL